MQHLPVGALLARTILGDSSLSRSLLPPIICCGFFCRRSAERIMPEVLLTRILPSEYIAHEFPPEAAVPPLIPPGAQTQFPNHSRPRGLRTWSKERIKPKRPTLRLFARSSSSYTFKAI